MQLIRIEAPNGPVYYCSPLLRDAGVPHAFSTRLGGVSPAPFDSLNLGNPAGDVKDDRARILENYERLFASVKLSGREHCWLHQIHGDVVACVSAGSAHDCNDKGDALATCDASRVLSVRVADCCPVLLATEDGKCVAAVHAGWRGTVAEAAVVALRAMMKMRSDVGVGNVIAAIGPCIGFDAFEIGEEVLGAFERVFGADAPIKRLSDGKGRADIRAAIRMSLMRAGVREEFIDVTDRCTHRDAGEFYSHRRENGITGRMAAVVGVHASA